MVSSASISQSWQKVDQKHYGMKYELPVGWEIDGFGWSRDWESVGSAVCDCSGTINIGNRWEEDEIYMVVYPTKYKDSLENSKRVRVWDMVFQEKGPQRTHKTGHCLFEMQAGKWQGDVNKRFQDDEVWRAKTTAKKQHYVLYFWADPSVMEENEETIFRIIDSFHPVKAR